MAGYWAQFFSLAIINIVALASPGPDFLITFRNSVFYSRRIGIYTALGIALGLMVHITYILCGLGAIIVKYVWLLTTIKVLGSAYLIYIGWKSFKTKTLTIDLTPELSPASCTASKAIRTGFLTNALNPKAIIFFLGVFTLVVSPTTPIPVLMVYGIEMILLTFLWFTIVALFLSQKKIVSSLHKLGKWVSRITGGLLISLGIKLVFTNLK